MDAEFSPQELAALKNEYAAEASQDQFNLWIAECQRRKLRPVSDIVMQVRSSQEYDPELRAKVSRKRCVFITGYHALRKIAERTNLYAGQQPSVFIYLDSGGIPSLKSEIPLPDRDGITPLQPWAVQASVLRKDFQEPMRFVARFWAYAQTYTKDGKTNLTKMWTQRGPEQLEKCAIAGALRAAFPEELSGLEVYEEGGAGGQPERQEPFEAEPVQPPPSTPAPPVDHVPAEGTDAPRPGLREELIQRIRDYAKKMGKDELKRFVLVTAGATDTKGLSNAQLAHVVAELDLKEAANAGV